MTSASGFKGKQQALTSRPCATGGRPTGRPRARPFITPHRSLPMRHEAVPSRHPHTTDLNKAATTEHANTFRRGGSGAA
jgi:hypothetical protein